MKALILAAGYGTRLRPYTEKIPKPLFPIDGRPLLDIHIRRLYNAGCRAIVVNTHHLHGQIAEFIKAQSYPIPIEISHEPEILGTGGAIKNIAAFWDNHPFMVVNSDVATIKARLEMISDSWPVCLDFGDDEPDKTLLLWLQEQNIGWCWHGVGTAEGLQQGILAVSRIRAQQDNPRQTREWVETALAGSSEHRQAILLFEGEPPAIELMRQAQVILDFL